MLRRTCCSRTCTSAARESPKIANKAVCYCSLRQTQAARSPSNGWQVSTQRAALRIQPKISLIVPSASSSLRSLITSSIRSKFSALDERQQHLPVRASTAPANSLQHFGHESLHRPTFHRKPNGELCSQGRNR